MSDSKKINMKERYEAMFVLHSLGDTLGFKNGEWEFLQRKRITLDIVNELMYQFITLGGINGIDISKWVASDDTLYHMATAKAMLKYKGKLDKKFILNMKNELINVYNQITGEFSEGLPNRFPGESTHGSIIQYTEDTDASHHPYNPASGGNGCAMKMLVVGAMLYGRKRRQELIDVSIRIGKMTHNSPIGFLAGFTTALFVALSIEGIDMLKWPFELLKLLESKKVKRHIDTDSIDELNDYLVFINQWRKYLDTRFQNGSLIKSKSHTNLMLRVKYYNELLVKDTKSTSIGSSGVGACIMAYDCVLDCTKNWEKLVVYSALHPGDTDTVCAIAGGLFGIQYGYSDTPKNLTDKMEFRKQLIKLSEEVFKKSKQSK